MYGLTQRERECLEFIGAMIDETGGIAPSFEEMKIALGCTSKSHVHRMVNALVKKGHIRRLPYAARALEIVQPEPSIKFDCPHCGGAL